MPDNIATREIRACRPGGSPFTITLRIGAPYPSGEVDWACAVGLDGLHDNLKPQHGVDSWQALCLAQNLARTLLRGFVEDGGQIFGFDGTGSDIDQLFQTASNQRLERP